LVTSCSGGRKEGPYLEAGTIRKKTKKGKIVEELADITNIRGFIVTTTSKTTGVKTPGGRLHIPDECPAELRVLMEALWSNKKKDRPTALQSILFLMQACSPILEEARAWENDAESAAKMKAWFVDDLGIALPHALDVFEQVNYEVLVQDNGLLEDTRTLLDDKGEAGLEFVCGDTFKALVREVKALKMLNEAVEQEPLKSYLAKACDDAEKEEGSAKMQEKLRIALCEIRARSAASGGETKVIDIIDPNTGGEEKSRDWAANPLAHASQRTLALASTDAENKGT
jgi:hypothetical protein